MRNYSLRSLVAITGLVLAFTPLLEASAQSKAAYYSSIESSCRSVLDSQNRHDLWLDIRASSVNDAGSSSGDKYNERVAKHCEWNLKGEKSLWNQIQNDAIASLPIPNPPYYRMRIAAHCESSLISTGHIEW